MAAKRLASSVAAICPISDRTKRSRSPASSAPLDQAGEGRATYRQIFIVHAKKRPIRFRVAYRWNDEPQKTRKKVITA